MDVTGWRTATASASASGNCVEVGVWRTASASVGANACVEVAPAVGGVAVRHSKDRDGPVLIYTAAEWQAFLSGVAAGEFTPEALADVPPYDL
jgi:hypothetical protein